MVNTKLARKQSGKKPARKVAAKASRDAAVVFRNIGTLCTMAGVAEKGGRRTTASDLGIIKDSAMLVSKGRIVKCGSEREILKMPEAKRSREIDLAGAVVIPALIECHTHLLHAGNRAGEFERRNQGESYQSIAKSGGGILATVLPTRAAAESELARIGQTRVERFLAQGVTTIESKSGYGLSDDAEFKMLRAAGRLSRARIVRTYLGAHAIPKEFSSAEEYVDHLIAKALPKLRDEGLSCRIDIFVEDGYFPRALAKRYLSAARALGFDVVVHADQLTRSGGAELAVELGARSADHLIQINASDIARLAASEVTCVLLPSSDLYMNCAYPPARKLIEAGARVALATDFNPGSCPSQDVALVGVLARIQMKMTFAEVLAAYTVGAAHALGFGQELGALEAGRFADFCVLSGDLEELFLEIGHMPVARVYRDGVQLV